jgi:hypothetical protein
LKYTVASAATPNRDWWAQDSRHFRAQIRDILQQAAAAITKEPLAQIAKSYGVDISMISRLQTTNHGNKNWPIALQQHRGPSLYDDVPKVPAFCARMHGNGALVQRRGNTRHTVTDGTSLVATSRREG